MTQSRWVLSTLIYRGAVIIARPRARHAARIHTYWKKPLANTKARLYWLVVMVEVQVNKYHVVHRICLVAVL